VGLLIAFSLLNFPDALLLLRVSQISDSLPFVVLAYAAYNAVYALLSYPAGALADRLGPQRVFAVGLACFALAYLGLGLTHSRAAVWPILLIYGGFTAATDGVGKAWIAGLVPPRLQGRGQGVYQGLTGGAVLVAGVWAGIAWGTDGTVPLLVAGIGTAALIPVLLLARISPAAPSRSTLP
jgi:MFS family permease